MLKRKIKIFLQALEDREITQREVAARLGYTERHVRNVLRLYRQTKTPSERAMRSKLAKARQQYRKLLAQTLSPRQAAERANCSLRTIYRYRNKV